MGTTTIINPDGITVIIGGLSEPEDYTGCYVAGGEYSDDYQGASQVKVTIYANRSLPIVLGARIFSDAADGAGGYILLSPPTIERVSFKYFKYDYTFLGNVHLLETKLFFNQDAKGEGWNLSFSLVGTATDFLNLICTNMNRTQPVADPITETWAVGTVDDTTSNLLIDFDNDNCLTALRKISEAFNLPYRTSLSGTTITLDLTNECRVHSQAYTIGEGLMKFRMSGDSDRPFATVLHVLGGTQNVPYDYRAGSRRLRAVSGELAAEEEVVYDDGTGSGSWTASKGNVIPGVNVNFSDTNAIYHGTSACKIYSVPPKSITGQIITIVNLGTPYAAAGGYLHLWVYLESVGVYDFTWAKLQVSVIDNTTQRNIEFGTGMYGLNVGNIGHWQELVIPLKDFGCTDYLIEGVMVKTTGFYAPNAILHLDYIYIAMNNLETDSFIYNSDDVAQHGRIEAVTINEDIYPKSALSVKTKVSEYEFSDSAIDFDLNEKDIDGNTIYMFAGVEPRINFTSGNLSGYSFSLKAYTTASKEIQIVPYTDDNGQKIPDETNDAFQFKEGDTYVITEINMPDSYITTAETDLLEWGQDEYLDFTAHNEIAEIEIDPVWVLKATDLKYTLLGDPTQYDLDPVVDLFKAGDLITVTIEGLFSRRLRVVSVTHEFFSKNAVWRLTLGNYKKVNLAGKLVGQINSQQGNLNTTNRNLKLVKYYMG